MATSATGLSFADYKKKNPSGTFSQWKGTPVVPPSSTPIMEKARAVPAASKTPTASNPVVSSQSKNPLPSPGNQFGTQYKTAGGQNLVKQGTMGQPQGSYYNDSQVKSMKGNLYGDLQNEGFTDQEIGDLAGTGNIRRALDNFSGIKESNAAEGGRYMEMLDPLSSANYTEILEKARGKKAIDQVNADLAAQEKKIQGLIENKYAPDYARAREDAQKAKETDMRVAGRSVYGSATSERQDQLNQRASDIEKSISAQQKLEEQQQLAIARGASEQEINSINEKISSISSQRAQIQQDLQLQTAGLDQQAVEMANEREKQIMKDSLEAAKSGLMYDSETRTYIPDPNFKTPEDPADLDISFQTANDGSVTQILTNKRTGEVTQTGLGQIGKGDIDGGTKFQIQFNPISGEQIIFDPSSGQSFNMGGPEAMFFGGGSQLFDPMTGAEEPMDQAKPTSLVESSPTSNSQGVQFLKDTKGLGGNCVLYARTLNPSLPYGLFDKNDKINAINKAGSKDWSKIKPGDTILSGEGSVGHAMTYIGTNPQTGKAVLEEANYTPGKVTKGREVSLNDPVFYGYVPNTKTPPQVFNANYQDEGKNVPITTQVEQTSGKATAAGILAMAQQYGKDINDPKERFNILNNFYKFGVAPGPDQEFIMKMEDRNYNKQKDAQDLWFKQKGFEMDLTNQNRSMSQDQFQMANTLRTDFDNQTAVKDFKTIQSTANEFKNIIGSGVQGPADTALVFKFMKALDPTSVVREGEFSLAANSAGQFNPDSIWAKFNGKFKDGRFINDQVRNDFLNLVNQSLSAKQMDYNQEANRYTGLSNTYGLNPQQVVYNYDQSMGANTSSPFAPPPTQFSPAAPAPQAPASGAFGGLSNLLNNLKGGGGTSPKPAAKAPAAAPKPSSGGFGSVFSKLFK